jgi:hypothetical protein
MSRRVFLLFNVFAVFAVCEAQTLPVTRAETLMGTDIDFPTAAKGEAAIFVLAFSHEAGDKIRPWVDALLRDKIATWGVADIEGAPFFVHGMIRSSMKKSTPQAQWNRTLILTKDSKAWRDALNISNVKIPLILVVRPNGSIAWSIEALYSADAYQQVKTQFSQIK